MKTNDIATAYIAYSDKVGGKRRPVLVVDDNDKALVCYRITSKYTNKSENIKQFYFSIEDWKVAGLNMKSWVDTKEYRYIYKKNDKVVYNKIGSLSLRDIGRFNDFLDKLQPQNEITIEDEILQQIDNNNICQSIENMYLSDKIVDNKFLEYENVEHFYSNHKNEIKKCISELSLSVGISEKEILGEDYKRNSCIIAYKVGLNNILKKIENGTIDPVNKHKINSQKNDLEME